MAKEISDRLDYLRMHYVDSLRIAMEKLKDTAEGCLKKLKMKASPVIILAIQMFIVMLLLHGRASWALSELDRLEDAVAVKIEEETISALQKMLDSRKQPSLEE